MIALRPIILATAMLCALLPRAAADTPGIVVDEVIDHGQPSLRIATPTGTWIYHREGAGFSRLIDRAGKDWLAYRPTGGAAGHYRGIPNAVFRRGQEGNNFFHPGHQGSKGSNTEIVLQTADRVLLRSTSRDHRWACEWEITATYARFRMIRTPEEDGGYWFLYEGTPGGVFNGADDCLRPQASRSSLADAWESDASKDSWTGFVSREQRRTLLIVSDAPAGTPVSYRPMENAMTVFGIGRKLGSLENFLNQSISFTVALVETMEPAELEAYAHRWRKESTPHLR